MIRALSAILIVILTAGGTAACNPEGPTGPKPFLISEVYGVWKVRMDDATCGPAKVLYLDFGPFGITPTQDSIQISGSWYLDQKNPDVQGLTGHIYRDSGLAYINLDKFNPKIVEGIFVSNRNFAGAYREPDGCVNRLRGKFLE
jgi:hypothetical protein